MNSLRLSEKTIDQVVLLEKDTFYWDKDLTGFGLKAYKSARRLSFFRGD